MLHIQRRLEILSIIKVLFVKVEIIWNLTIHSELGQSYN